MVGRLTPLDIVAGVTMPSLDLRQRLDQHGLIGPFLLSASALDQLQPLIEAAAAEANPRNLHARLPLAQLVISDSAITSMVKELFQPGYQLWRTNFFRRDPGVPHPGVELHHDKHFQSGDSTIDFFELGDHLSIVIALNIINASNGCFLYLPGSHRGQPPGMVRDKRPFEQRPLEDHFPTIPPSLHHQFEELALPAGSFCLFHSALLHGSRPSGGVAGRMSMVGRLVRSNCTIPVNCADVHEVMNFC